MDTPVSFLVPAAWAGIVDDAAIFPPGNADLADALTAFLARSAGPYAALVGALVVSDDRVGRLDAEAPVSVVATGGAGSVVPALALLQRGPATAAGVEVALRDLDDLPGNARRVVAAVEAARAEGLLADEVPAYVELPALEPSAGWLRAADEVAAAELRLKFRTGGAEARQFPDPTTLASWIDAALDRETPFKCTAGLHHALRHRDPDTGFEHHGFLNLLLATRVAFDGSPAADVAAVLDDRDADALVARAEQADLAGGRRWFTGFGSCSVEEPLADLRALGLLP